MQDSKKLYDLIATLSKSEKIYLKKFAFLHDREKKNNYIELFDILQKYSIRDDKKLAEVLEKKSISKNLSSIKHYLYKLILRSLRNYHHSEHVSTEVKNYLSEIRILHQRGLYNQCRSLISSTKKIVLKYEMNVEYLLLLKAEYNLLLALYSSVKEIRKIFIQQKKVLETISNSMEYQELSAEIFGLIEAEQIPPGSMEKARELFSSPLLTDLSRARTFYDKSNFYFINSRRRFLTGDKQSVKQYLLKNVELWEANPHFIKDNVSEYMVLLHSLMSLYAHNYKERKFVEEIIAKIKSISSDVLYIEARIYFFAYMSQQDHSIYLGNFEEERKTVPLIERELIKFDAVTPESTKYIFYFNTAHILFGSREYYDSLIWIDKALEMESRVNYFYYSLIMRIMKLLIFIEMNDMESFDTSLRSLTRKKNKELPLVLNLMIGYLKKYNTVFSDKQQVKQLLSSTIQGLKDAIKDPAERWYVEIFDFISFLESKLTGRTFGEIVREKVQKD